MKNVLPIVVLAGLLPLRPLLAQQKVPVGPDVSFAVTDTRSASATLITLNLTASANGPSLQKVNSAVDAAIAPLAAEWEGKKGVAFLRGTRLIAVGQARNNEKSNRLWRIDQPITIIAAPSARLLDLLQSDQPGVTISSIGSAASPEDQSKAEGNAVEAAIGKFIEKAKNIQKGFSAKGYSIVSINLSTSTTLAHDQPSQIETGAADNNRVTMHTPAEASASDSQSLIVSTISGVIRLAF